MPEFDVKRPVPPKKKRKKKHQNPVVEVLSGIIPWKGDSSGDIIRKLVFLVSIGVLIYAFCAIANFYLLRDRDTDAELETFTQLKENAKSDDVITILINDDDNGGTADDTSEQKEVQILSEYQQFYEANDEFVGWVAIKPYVNYPVAQSTDNEYYLKHNFYKEPTENGSIFADYQGKFSSTEVPNNIILYGHNLITKNYFEPLSHYREDIAFLKDNYTIEFDTLYEKGTYKIFSVFLTNTLESHGEVFDYYNHVYFGSKQEFDDYVAECIDRSYYYTGVDLQYGDELLTLSTCDFSMFSDMRLVVVARKVREDESPFMDPETFIDNSGFDENGYVKRKMFDAYYSTFGRQWAGRKWDTSCIKDFSGT